MDKLPATDTMMVSPGRAMNMGGKRQFPRVNATRCVAGLLFTWILAFPTRAADVDNLGTSARRIVLRGDYVAYTVLELQEDNTDFNGDGDTNDPVVFIRNIVTGDVTNTGLSGEPIFFEDGLVAIMVNENWQGGQDLNGDMEPGDRVIHVWDVEAGSVRNTQLAGGAIIGIGAGVVAFCVNERSQGDTDLNGDGDAIDIVVHTLDPTNGMITNHQLATSGSAISRSHLVVAVSEFSQNATDLNSDNDALDDILHEYDPVQNTFDDLGVAVGNRTLGLEGALLGYAVPEPQVGSDLNGDGDNIDDVACLRDLDSQETVNTGLAIVPFFSVIVDDRHALLRVSESNQDDTDLNSDGDIVDDVPHVYSFDYEVAVNLGVEGDAKLEAGRVVYLVDELTESTVDLNNDGDRDDSVYHTARVRGPVLIDFRNVRLPGRGSASDATNNRRYIAIRVSESDHGRGDLNGDGDELDLVLHIFDIRASSCPTTAGTVDNIGLALGSSSAWNLDGDRLAFPVGENVQGNTDLNGDGDAIDPVLHIWDIDAGPCIECVPIKSTLEGEPVLVSSGPGLYEVKIDCRDAATNESLDDTGLLYRFRYSFQNIPSTDDDDCESTQIPSWTTVCVGPQESNAAIINFLPGSALPSWGVTDSTPLGRSWNHGTGECVPPPPLVPTFVPSGSSADMGDLIDGTQPSFSNIEITSGAALNGSSAQALNDGSVYASGDINDVAGLASFVPAADTKLVVELDTAFSPSGYDVTSVALLSADATNRDPAFEVQVRQVGRDEWVTLQSLRDNIAIGFCGTVLIPSPNPGEQERTLTVASGGDTIASKIDALRVTFFETTTYREIDLVGIPSGEVFPQTRFSRGDCNDDGSTDISDAICALGWLFLGAERPGCVAALNTNGDGLVDISDSVALLGFLFLGGLPPVPPFPNCGPGDLPADTEVGCAEEPEACQ